MNRGSDSILSVYSDARAEYTKQLCVFLVPAYFQFFIELLEKAKLDMTNEPKRALWQFQNYLNEVHDWNMEKVHNEIHRIHTNSGCDYLEDLLTAVFIAHTKVLTAIRLSSNRKKIEINVPKVEHFLFKVLCETSKLLWSSTYLFRDGIPGIEKQQNYRNIEQIINEGILQAVRSLVPVKSILKDFVTNDNTEIPDDDDDSDDEDEKEELNKEIKHTEEITIPPPVIIQEPIKIQAETTFSPDIPILPQQTTQVIAPSVSLEKIESKHQNEIIKPKEVIQQEPPQTIIIDDKPTVRFGDFDAVFDSDNPHESDMVYEPKDEDEDDDDDDTPALEILDEQGTPLAEGLDFDDLDEKPSESLEEGEYESL
jgi:hypothetical protein